MENNRNVLLIDKLVQLNDLEITKAKLLTAIFTKTTKEIMHHKVQVLEKNFEEQAEFYDQNLERYEEICDQILIKYKKQLSQIIEKYNGFYINLLLELQEAQCNQKIAITNLKKSFDSKQEISSQTKAKILEEWNQKMTACREKKLNYDVIIEECEKEIEECSSNMQKKMDALFSDKLSQISLKEKKSSGSFWRKIKNKFTGAKKFNTYVIEPICVELEIMDNKLPDILNNIKEDTIYFVAKIKQAKEEANKIFQNTING